MNPLERIRGASKSTVTFGLLAAYFLVLGLVYLWVPIAPYHQEMIGMSAAELASAHPSIHALLTALVDIAGISSLVAAIAFFGFGRDAPERPSATLALVAIFALFTAPAVYIVYRIDGPLVVVAIPLVIHLVGLGLLYTEKEWTPGAGEATPQ